MLSCINLKGGLLMRILNFLRKRKQSKTSKNLEIVLKTDLDLTEEQRNTIITIVKEGIQAGEEICDIAILIMMKVEIYKPVLINRYKNSIEIMIF